MTEGSSKSLTWGTLLAGVLSAAALAAIGCVKPIASRDGASPLGVNLPGSADPRGPQQRYISRETPQRSGDNDLRSASH
jgi:hypothetical protein